MRAALTSVLAIGVIATMSSAVLAQGVLGAHGRCKLLRMAGNDLTRSCGRGILNTFYPDGRVGFYFGMADGSVVTFSGYDRPRPTPDTGIVTIDKIIVGSKKTGRDTTFAAFGQCTYGNFHKGHKIVDCRATSQDGSEHRGIFELTSAPQ